MQYLLMIYYDESQLPPATSPERQALVGRYNAVVGEIAEAGQWVDGRPLQPTNTASTVRVTDGETMVVDGPFAETREQLIGFFLVDCESQDEALAYAAKIPAARSGGSVEVRPIQVYDFPDD